MLENSGIQRGARISSMCIRCAWPALQVKGALRELRDALPELLRSRRSGVVAALLAAAARCGNAAVQADAARAMASALAALQSQHDNSNSNQVRLTAREVGGDYSCSASANALHTLHLHCRAWRAHC